MKATLARDAVGMGLTIHDVRAFKFARRQSWADSEDRQV